MAKIEIYTRDWCGYCAAAKALLDRKGAAYQELNAGADPALRDDMLSRSNGGRTYPQIFIDGRHIGGSDDLHALDRAGGLDPLLR
ncbi:glutaredoxin 3 [bacterium]|nr:glutaredoxin 3 [bacterium]